MADTNTPQSSGESSAFQNAPDRGWADAASGQQRRPNVRFEQAPQGEGFEGNSRSTSHSGDTSDGAQAQSAGETDAGFGPQEPAASAAARASASGNGETGARAAVGQPAAESELTGSEAPGVVASAPSHAPGVAAEQASSGAVGGGVSAAGGLSGGVAAPASDPLVAGVSGANPAGTAAAPTASGAEASGTTSGTAPLAGSDTAGTPRAESVAATNAAEADAAAAMGPSAASTAQVEETSAEGDAATAPTGTGATPASAGTGAATASSGADPSASPTSAATAETDATRSAEAPDAGPETAQGASQTEPSSDAAGGSETQPAEAPTVNAAPDQTRTADSAAGDQEAPASDAPASPSEPQPASSAPSEAQPDAAPAEPTAQPQAAETSDVTRAVADSPVSGAETTSAQTGAPASDVSAPARPSAQDALGAAPTAAQPGGAVSEADPAQPAAAEGTASDDPSSPMTRADQASSGQSGVAAYSTGAPNAHQEGAAPLGDTSASAPSTAPARGAAAVTGGDPATTDAPVTAVAEGEAATSAEPGAGTGADAASGTGTDQASGAAPAQAAASAATGEAGPAPSSEAASSSAGPAEGGSSPAASDPGTASASAPSASATAPSSTSGPASEAAAEGPADAAGISSSGAASAATAASGAEGAVSDGASDPADSYTGAADAASAATSDAASPSAATGNDTSSSASGAAPAATAPEAEETATASDSPSGADAPAAAQSASDGATSGAPSSPSAHGVSGTAPASASGASTAGSQAPAGPASSDPAPGTAEGGAAPTETPVEAPVGNHSPVSITLSGSTVPENVEGAILGRVTAQDPDAGDRLSYEVSDSRFEIVNGNLKLRDGVALDHEESADLELNITATDQDGGSYTDAFDVSVADLNEAPTGLGFEAARPDMPQDVPVAGDTVTLDVRLAGEAYRGDPRYEIVVDGEVVAKGSVDWSRETTTEGRYDLNSGRDEVEWRDVSVDLTMPPGGFETVEVRFPNDAYRRGVGDRNLIVDQISIDGNSIQAESTEVHYDGGKFRGDTTSERMPWRGELEFDVSNIFDDAAPQEAPDGAYVIEGTPGAVIGQVQFSDADLGDSHSLSVSDDRFEVVDGALKLRDGVALDHEAAASVSVEVTVTDAAGAQSSLTVDVGVVDTVDLPPPSIDVEPSFVARHFDVNHRLRSLSDIDFTADPTHVDAISDINFENSRESFWEHGSKDTFGTQITGQIDVPEDGTFTFTMGSDDGAMLYVDGIPVIDHDRLHAFRAKDGEIELDAGPHTIEVLYFENYGRAGLKLEWEGPGIDGTQLVTPGVGEDGMMGIAGEPFDFALDLAFAAGRGTVTIDGLPDGTLVEIGGTSLVAEGGSVDLTGHEGTLVSLTPPDGVMGPVEATVTATDQSGASTETALEFEVVAPPWEPEDVAAPEAAPEGLDDAELLDQMDAAAGDSGGDLSAVDEAALDAQIELAQDDMPDADDNMSMAVDF